MLPRPASPTHRLRGIKLPGEWRPERLSIRCQGDYHRSVFSSYMDPLTGEQVAGGNTPYAPNLITRVSGRDLVDQHHIPAAMTLAAALRTESRTFFDPENQFSQGPIALLDLGAEFAINPKKTLRVFADNVTDRACRTYSFAFAGLPLATINKPLIAGASVATRF